MQAKATSDLLKVKITFSLFCLKLKYTIYRTNTLRVTILSYKQRTLQVFRMKLKKYYMKV